MIEEEKRKKKKRRRRRKERNGRKIRYCHLYTHEILKPAMRIF